MKTIELLSRQTFIVNAHWFFDNLHDSKRYSSPALCDGFPKRSYSLPHSFSFSLTSDCSRGRYSVVAPNPKVPSPTSPSTMYLSRFFVLSLADH